MPAAPSVSPPQYLPRPPPRRKRVATEHRQDRPGARRFHGHHRQPGVSSAADALRSSGISCKVVRLRSDALCPWSRADSPRGPGLVPDVETLPFRILDCELRIALPLNLKSKFQNPKSRPERKSNRCSELDRVTLQFIIERGPLNAEKLRGFFLVAVTLRKRLKNRVPLDLVQTLHTCARRSTALRLLQHRGQLHFGGQLFHANQILPRQHHRVFHCVLQFA